MSYGNKFFLQGTVQSIMCNNGYCDIVLLKRRKSGKKMVKNLISIGAFQDLLEQQDVNLKSKVLIQFYIDSKENIYQGKRYYKNNLIAQKIQKIK